MLSIFKKSESKLDAELAGLLAQGAKVIDVRTEAEFASGHVKGSKNIPLDTLQTMASSLSRDQHLVLCCRSGGRSAQAKSMLQSMGFSHVYNGGSWQHVNNHLKK